MHEFGEYRYLLVEFLWQTNTKLGRKRKKVPVYTNTAVYSILGSSLYVVKVPKIAGSRVKKCYILPEIERRIAAVCWRWLHLLSAGGAVAFSA